MNVALYRRTAKDVSTVARYAKDIPRTKIDRLLFDHALLGLALGLGSLIAIFGLRLGLVSAFVHLNLYLAGSAAVNALAHNFGRRPYANRASNLQLLAFLTAGEGLHNNHHAAPSSPRLMKWGMTSNGKCLTAKITEYHKTGNECSLSDILEEQVDQKYFLSSERMKILMRNLPQVEQLLEVAKNTPQ